jgi:hypothetical protein
MLLIREVRRLRKVLAVQGPAALANVANSAVQCSGPSLE